MWGFHNSREAQFIACVAIEEVDIIFAQRILMIHHDSVQQHAGTVYPFCTGYNLRYEAMLQD